MKGHANHRGARDFRVCMAATWLTAGITVAHAQPQAFTEEAVARGIAYHTAQSGVEDGFGCGMALVDLDGDHDADAVLIGRADGAVGVYENDGTGHFVDRSANSGIPAVLGASGVTAADYDADGDLDLHISQWLLPNLLLRNEGNFQFTDVTAAALVGDAGAGTGCAWGDYDGDGWLDLYVSNLTHADLSLLPNRLYRNLGDGTFADVGPATGLDDSRRTFQAIFFDMDRDGDADLYLSTDKGEPGVGNRLFENSSGTMLEISDGSGADVAMNSMGVAVGDFDGNGFLDLYPTNTQSGNPLLLNFGGGEFSDHSAAAGTYSYAIGWGALFVDFDNDGHLELYVCNMFAPNRLYRHAGTWPCTDIAATVNVAIPNVSYAVAAADIDDDGDLDMLVQNYNEPIRLLVNHEGSARRWAKFRVIGEQPNRFAVGAVIDVRVGSTRRIRDIAAGANYKSQNEYTVHFGLNGAVKMNEIDVLWPGGATRKLTGYATNTTWAIYPPGRLGDGNGDGAVTAADAVRFGDCLQGPAPGGVSTGCEMMDVNGDATVDLRDYALFQARF